MVEREEPATDAEGDIAIAHDQPLNLDILRRALEVVEQEAPATNAELYIAMHMTKPSEP